MQKRKRKKAMKSMIAPGRKSVEAPTPNWNRGAGAQSPKAPLNNSDEYPPAKAGGTAGSSLATQFDSVVELQDRLLRVHNRLEQIRNQLLGEPKEQVSSDIGTPPNPGIIPALLALTCDTHMVMSRVECLVSQLESL